MFSGNKTTGSGGVGWDSCHCVQDTDTAVTRQFMGGVVTAMHVSVSGQRDDLTPFHSSFWSLLAFEVLIAGCPLFLLVSEATLICRSLLYSADEAICPSTCENRSYSPVDA